MIGWIKLHRKVWDNPRSCDPEWLSVWVYLICHASHEAKSVVFQGKRHNLNPGQLITSRRIISKHTGVNQSKVQRILDVLKSEQQIEPQKSNLNTLISIRKWEEYQSYEPPSEPQMNHDRTTTEPQVNHEQELREVKETKEGGVAPAHEEILISNPYENLLAKLNSHFVNDSIFELVKGQTSFRGDVKEQMKNFAAHYSAHKPELALKEVPVIVNWFRNWLTKDGWFAAKMQSGKAPEPTAYVPQYRRPVPEQKMQPEPQLSPEELAEKKRKAEAAFQEFKKNFKAPAVRTGTKSLRELLGTEKWEKPIEETEKISSPE